MQVLKLSPKYISDFNNPKVLKTLRIYGYKNKEDFFQKIINELNKNYDFLDIKKIEPYDFSKYNQTYGMYNGFIEGNLKTKKEIIISLTPLKDAKQGNVFIYQQITSMISNKIKHNYDFLLDKNIIKICLLTSHFSEKTPESNKLKERNNSTQFVINSLNTIGFDFLEIFRIKGLSINKKYNNVEQFIDHMYYLNNKNNTNVKTNFIKKKEKTFDLYFEPSHFNNENSLEGQTIKFNILRAYSLIHLIDVKDINLLNYSTLVKQSKDVNVTTFIEYIKYIQKNNIHIIGKNNIESIVDEKKEEVISIDNQELYDKNIEEHLLPPKYNINFKTGKCTKIRVTQYIENAISKNNYKCIFDKNDHETRYFISEKTKENYLEGHHMILYSNQEEIWKDYKTNVDSTINIIPVCSHCHHKLHKGRKIDKLKMLSELYIKFNTNLKLIKPDITEDEFFAYYDVYIY